MAYYNCGSSFSVPDSGSAKRELEGVAKRLNAFERRQVTANTAKVIECRLKGLPFEVCSEIQD